MQHDFKFISLFTRELTAIPRGCYSYASFENYLHCCLLVLDMVPRILFQLPPLVFQKVDNLVISYFIGFAKGIQTSKCSVTPQ